jgi:type I restriction enzyme, R subunit
VILALLEKYRLAGVGEMTAPEVYDLSPFREMGRMRGVARRLGGADTLRETLDEMQRRIYRKESG